MLGDNEVLARFIFSANHFAATKKRVKPAAFMPPQNLQLSVFRIQDLTDEETWDVAVAITDRSVRARGDIAVSGVRGASLDVEPDDIPLRHANIVGWPKDKAKQKQIAMELAAQATLVIKPS